MAIGKIAKCSLLSMLVLNVEKEEFQVKPKGDKEPPY